VSLRYSILNLMVFVVVILLASRTYKAWINPIEVTPEKEGMRKTLEKVKSPPIVGDKKESSNLYPHVIISEKNIFNPERKEFPTQTKAEVKKPVVRPQIALYGITLADDYQSACIGNSGTPVKKGEREAMTLKIGDNIGEYKLAKILPDRIALEAMEDTFEVLLYDPAKPKKRIYAKSESKPAAITTTIPASSAASASPQIIPAQESPKAAGSVRERTTKTPLPRPAPPTPSPSPRSRRTAPYAPGTSAPTGQPEALPKTK